jgi:hypothetical protein
MMTALLFALLAQSEQLPQGRGRETVIKVCGACHAPEAIIKNRNTRKGWTELVDEMIFKGAKATATPKSTRPTARPAWRSPSLVPRPTIRSKITRRTTNSSTRPRTRISKRSVATAITISAATRSATKVSRRISTKRRSITCLARPFMRAHIFTALPMAASCSCPRPQPA